LVGSLLRFDPRHLSIVILPSCRQLRLDPAVVGADRRIFVFGGCVDVPHGASGNTVLDTVECYDVAANKWLDLPSLPLPVHSHAACVVQSSQAGRGGGAAGGPGSTGDFRIFISGGVTAPGGVVTSTVMTFDPATNRFTQKSPMNCSRRLHEMASVGAVHIYVLGGINSHTFHNAQTLIPIERYDIATDQVSFRCVWASDQVSFR